MSDTGKGTEYFAAREAKDAATILEAKIFDWSNGILKNGLLDKLRNCYKSYHGAYFANTGDSHNISFSGDQGELVNLGVNHFRNIATHMLNMTCSTRPSLDCRATNTDYKSLVQTSLANDILDYYMREKKLEVFVRQAVEYAIVYGTGYVVMEWNATSGEIYDYMVDEETGLPDQSKPIHEGDLHFENLSPFDVVYDSSRENNKHDWVLIRRWKNKYDLVAKYPELEDKIGALPTKSDLDKFRFGFVGSYDETTDVQILEFYHKKTESLPNGRYMMFSSHDTVYQDLPLPYHSLPVFAISPGHIHGTPFGYTPMFDLLNLQVAENSLHSTIMTNQNATGVQNILVPRGADITPSQLVGGLNIIEFNEQAGKPSALNLTATPQEVFKYLQMLEEAMNLLSGVNSVARGQPQASLESGTALALVQSMALQFMSGLQQSYVELLEEIGGSVIKILQDYASTPRMIALGGKSNRTKMKEFLGKDISNITRVIVDIGNPLSRTTAGRVQMAQELIQYGDITPKQYVSIIHTGSIDDLTESVLNENLLMRAENESILDGEIPQAVFIENHKEHIDYHRSVLFDPELKKDAELVNRVQQHIQQHVNLLRTTDPDLLMIMGQQPLQPLMPPPGMAPVPGGPPPGPGIPMPPDQGLVGPSVNGGQMENPGMGSVRIPEPAKVSPELLPNPVLQAPQGNLKG